MGRLKKDHSGWRTSGIWTKYQQPTINEVVSKSKSKKDTNKWCRGRVGREHEWHAYQKKEWCDELWQFIRDYTEIKCVKCKKQKYIKTAKSHKYPLHLYINDLSEKSKIIKVRLIV